MLSLQMKGKDFVLPYEILAKFCKTVEFTNKKNDYIYIQSDGAIFTIFAQSSLASVMWRAEAPSGKQFCLGFDSSKFCALVKKLYTGSPIWFRPKAKSIVVEEDNISVKFSVLDYVQQYNVPEMIKVPTDAVDWLVRSIWRCDSAISTKGAFEKAGILVDNTSPGVTRVTKISGGGGVRITNAQKLFKEERRFVVAPGLASALYSFREEIEELSLSTNHVGVRVGGGVFAYMPLMVDEYPTNYVQMLGLADQVQQIDPARPRYVFDRDSLVNALDLVSSVSGREETQVLWQLVGAADGSTRPVWQLSARALDGCTASEVIACEDGASFEERPFKVHRRNMVNILQQYNERVALYNYTDRNIAISDVEGTDVTLMSKFDGGYA